MKKRAVLVGINKYQSVNQLDGCVNDVLDWRAVLLMRGWEADNIRVLTDERASRFAILDRLEWLVTTAKNDDVILFVFSGHGTQLRDWNGDELNDYVDEALVTWEYDGLSTDYGLLLDDMLAEIFQRLAGTVKAYVVLDCCHSGTATRGLSKTRTVAVHRDVQLRSESRPGLPVRKIGRAGSDTQYLNVLPMTHLLLTACAANETAADATFGLEARPNGAFTHALLPALMRPAETMLQVTENCRTAVAAEGFAQSPQIEGPADLINSYFP